MITPGEQFLDRASAGEGILPKNAQRLMRDLTNSRGWGVKRMRRVEILVLIVRSRLSRRPNRAINLAQQYLSRQLYVVRR